MLDELKLGADYRVVPFQDELAGSHVSFNGRSEGFHTVVIDTPVLRAAFEVGVGETVQRSFVTSHIAQSEINDEASLTQASFRPFTPRFEDSEYVSFDPSQQLLHRIVSIHPNGAILFHTTVIGKTDDHSISVKDVGFFLQADFYSKPIPVPEETVLGFTGDSDRMVINCSNNHGSTVLLIFIPKENNFKKLSLPDEVVAFYGGALDQFYVYGKSDPVIDGGVIPHYANVGAGKAFPLRAFDQVTALSNAGVVVGQTIKDDSFTTQYMHPTGTRGEILCNPSSGLTAIPDDLTQIELTHNYHLFTGCGATTQTVNEGLFGEKIVATPRHGLFWVASDTELHEGCNVPPLDIEARLPFSIPSPILRLSHPADNLSMVGHTRDEEVLLIPITS